MEKLKVVQIGAGHDHAFAPFGSLKKRTDIEFLGYARVEGETNTIEGAPELKYEDVLKRNDIDAVFVETEDRYLTDYAAEFVKRGIPVQMDKPGGQDKKSFDALFDMAKEKNVPLHLGYMYRYNPAIQKLLRQIRAGELGEIYYVEAHMNCLHSESKRAWLKDYKGGMMNFLGCHLVDLVYQIMGKPDKILPFNAASQNTVGEDISFAVFLYGNKPSFIKSTAVESSGYLRRQIVVCGEKGTIELNPTEYAAKEGNGLLNTNEYESLLAEHGKEWGYRPEKKVYGPYDRYDAMYDEFFKIVRGEIKNPYTYEYEKEVHDLVLRACGVEI